MYPALCHETCTLLLILSTKPLCKTSTYIVFVWLGFFCFVLFCFSFFFSLFFFADEEIEIQGGCDLPKVTRKMEEGGLKESLSLRHFFKKPHQDEATQREKEIIQAQF